MQERGVVDVERNLANERERVFPVFVVEDPYVTRDQAAEGIKGETADRSFDATFVQLFNELVTPLPSKTLLGQIPTARSEGQYQRQHNKTQGDANNSPQ